MTYRRRAAWLACRILMLLLIAPATGSTAYAQSAAPAPPLRVMSFNLRYGTADDGNDAWPLRRYVVVRTIRDFEPTVLGVQEALRFQLDELHAAFPHLAEVGVGRDDGAEAGEYSAILYDRRRLERLDSGTFWLSDTPEVVASTSWGNRITRIVTWARFRDRATDPTGSRATLYVFNTHWDHESQPSRERSAELLRRRIEQREGNAPIIVTGDFNAGERNPAFQRLVGGAGDGDAVELRDTFRMLHPGAEEVGTFNGFTGDRTGEKIDAILVSPEWRVLAAEIDRRNDGGRYPSDHFPVTAILEVASAGHSDAP